MKKPNFFIVGAAKSGTTALHSFLEQHPDIFMSTPKELRFFCKDFIEEHDSFLKNHTRVLKRENYYRYRTEQEYLAVFANGQGKKIIGESSPCYLYSCVAANEIHTFNPNAKIIIMLRNPVDFLYSAHSQLLKKGHETVADFNKALALEPERRKGTISKLSLITQPSKLFYSKKAKFSEQIQRYIDVFDKSQIKIIIFDDFKKNNETVYKDVLHFLGVRDDYRPEFKSVNSNKRVRFRGFKRIIESSLFINTLGKLTYILPKTIRNTLVRTTYKLIMKKEARLPMNSELRKTLMQKYKPEVEKLSKLVNRDLLTLWGYDSLD